MTDIKTASEAIYRMILSLPVPERLIAAAASYFSHSETAVTPHNFRHWFAAVSRDLENQVALQDCAKRWQQRLKTRKNFNQQEAEEFQRDYLVSLDITSIMRQAIVAGFVQRPAGTQFDIEFCQPRQTNAWLLIATTKGEARVRSGLRDWKTQEAEILLFSPTATYQIQRVSSSPEWCHFWFSFQPLNEWRYLLDWPKSAPDAGRVRLSEPAWAILKTCMQQLLNNFEEGSIMQNELNTNLLEQCLLHCNNQFDAKYHRQKDDRITRAKAFIDTHYREDFKLKDVADAAHLSSSRLAALFKNDTGISVLNWRDEKRLIEAMHLLRNTDISIASIGEQVGMSDATYFSRQFKKYAGNSPRQYRQSGLQSVMEI